MSAILLAGCTTENQTQNSQPLTCIAFGSCAMQILEQSIWDTVAAQNPDLFLFIGDAIYGDYDAKTKQAFTPTKETLDRDWGLLAAEPHFAKFRETTPIMATWDNHDYGTHNGGGEFPLKVMTKTQPLCTEST